MAGTGCEIFLESTRKLQACRRVRRYCVPAERQWKVKRVPLDESDVGVSGTSEFRRDFHREVVARRCEATTTRVCPIASMNVCLSQAIKIIRLCMSEPLRKQPCIHILYH